MKRVCVATIIAILVCVEVTAQEHRILSRRELDSLVHPTLSQSADGIASTGCRVRNLGIVDVNSPQNVRFEVVNTTDSDIEIREVRSSCSCIDVISSPTHLQGGECADIELQFNPAGRSGEFRIDVWVYTSLDLNHPTERLTIVGSVRNEDCFTHLRYSAGVLRMSRREVTFEGVKAGVRREERIVVANTTDRPLQISAQSTVEGLSLRCEPETIEAGEETDMVITLQSTNTPETEYRTIMVLEGVGGRVTERMINITIKP